MLNVMEVRKQAYRNLCGQHITELSPNAQQALQTKKLSKSFWKHWDSKYQKCITKKRQGTVFDSYVLTFLRGKNRLFITPPDTTGATQLLDQINQKLHSEYRSAKSELFIPFMTINREGFMKILATLWPEWASKERIINAGKKVGISSGGLSVEWMQ